MAYDTLSNACRQGPISGEPKNGAQLAQLYFPEEKDPKSLVIFTYLYLWRVASPYFSGPATVQVQY